MPIKSFNVIFEGKKIMLIKLRVTLHCNKNAIFDLPISIMDGHPIFGVSDVV